LYVCYKPGKAMSKMTGRVERMIEINNVESIGSYKDRQICLKYNSLEMRMGRTYEARATSLPEGEIVADPTLRST